MKKSLVALAYSLRQPKYRGRKNHNLPIKFDREESPEFVGAFFIDKLAIAQFDRGNDASPTPVRIVQPCE